MNGLGMRLGLHVPGRPNSHYMHEHTLESSSDEEETILQAGDK